MRRFNLLFGIFVLSLFVIPSFKANAATEVSNEEQLREAISQGGDIVIKDKIEVKDTLVINKDVNITGSISDFCQYIVPQMNKTKLSSIWRFFIFLSLGTKINYRARYFCLYSSNNFTFNNIFMVLIPFI